MNDVVSKLEVKNWQVKFSPIIYQLNDKILEQADSIITDWQKAFVEEDTWVQKFLKIPSLFIRLDCVVENGFLKIFEVEERPGGIGVMNVLHSGFNQKLKLIKKQWPEIKCVVSEKRHSQDDYLWTETINLSETGKEDGVFLVRAEPDESEFHYLENRSISSLRAKGDKSYGVSLGLWNEVTLSDYNDLDWQNGFCLKEKQTSKTRGVYIYHPQKNYWQNKGIGGIATKSKIREVLSGGQKMYCQQFVNPMTHGEELMIYRVFFLYNLGEGKYEFSGGFWNSRKNFKIHGASDSSIGMVW